MNKYARNREGFIDWFKTEARIPKSNYHFNIEQSFLDSSGEVFSNTDMEACYKCWFHGWGIGFGAALEGIEDNRIGICDKVNPDLLTKKLRDWG